MTKIITALELQGRTLDELHTLHRNTQQELARTVYGSDERRIALANLETITQAIRTRRLRHTFAGPRP